MCQVATSPSLPKLPQFLLLPGVKIQALPDRSGRLWAATETEAIAYDGQRPLRKLTRQADRSLWRHGPLVPGRDGQLWFLGETVQGLFPEITYTRASKGVPTAGFQDKQGHLWVAVRGEGLVEWTTDAKWEYWPSSDLESQAVNQLAKDQRGLVFASAAGSLMRLDQGTRHWNALAHTASQYDAVFPYAPGELLVSTVNDGLWRMSTNGKRLERLGNVVRHPSRVGWEPDWVREAVRDGSGQVWIASEKGLFRLDGARGNLQLTRDLLPGGLVKAPQGLDLEIDSQGRLWLGSNLGIWWREESKGWQQLKTDPPLSRVRSIALGRDADDDIWAAYDRPGHFSRIRKKGGRWVVKDFVAIEGYRPPYTSFIKRDSRGWIWRGSLNGVHVCNGRDTGLEDWILLDASNGLVSTVPSEYGFFEDPDGSVWIAGSEGVTHFYPDSSWFNVSPTAKKPRITRVEVDGREMPPNVLDGGNLPGNLSLLRFEIGTFDTSGWREYPFRYRILPGLPEWLLSRDGRLEMANPPAGSYRLEVAYSGEGSAPPLLQQFQVGTPFKVLVWRWGLGLAGLVSAVLFAKYRTNWFDKAFYRGSKFLYLRKLQREDLAAEEPAPLLRAGELLEGKYRIVQPISRGGFSRVYEGQSLNGGTPRVAIKILNQGLKHAGRLRDRFAVEVAALGAVKHPGVVPVLDWWISETGEPCLVMPFLEGPTLRSLLIGGHLTSRQTARVLRQIGDALAEIHARGIIHRDLKPENIILVNAAGANEQAVILDFGTAGLRGADGELAVTTMLAGSLHYMAPEQLTGHYSTAADIYSFAAITLELCTGRRLFDLGVYYSSPAFLGKLECTLSGPLGADVARRLAGVLAPAFSPQPEERPLQVGVWATEMAEILDPVRQSAAAPST